MNFDIWVLFFMGLIFSFLAYLGNLLEIEEDKIKDKSKKAIFTIVLAKATLGGTLAVLVFYGLAEVTNFNEYLRAGIAGTVAILTENSKKLMLTLINKKLGVTNEL